MAVKLVDIDAAENEGQSVLPLRGMQVKLFPCAETRDNNRDKGATCFNRTEEGIVLDDGERREEGRDRRSELFWGIQGDATRKKVALGQ